MMALPGTASPFPRTEYSFPYSGKSTSSFATTAAVAANPLIFPEASSYESSLYSTKAQGSPWYCLDRLQCCPITQRKTATAAYSFEGNGLSLSFSLGPEPLVCCVSSQ